MGVPANIREYAYELYIADWKKTHITEAKEQETINEYSDMRESGEFTGSYGDFLNEYGYEGELYACFYEFLTSEYLDEDYMKLLLCSKELLEHYFADVHSVFHPWVNLRPLDEVVGECRSIALEKESSCRRYN